uniref:Zinc finger, CCHC-type n=1 Tax=Tanacetum cinerariifolium TaxID=118510 RepID=A0A699IAN0_TANCI|nr:zinc finger, CCHC-type [Tanacetum cinerariifolium]
MAKKMHFLLSSMSVVYVLTTLIPEDGDDATVKQLIMEQYNELFGILGRFTQHKMNMDEAVQVSYIIDKLPHSWKDFNHTLKLFKKELNLVELGNHLRIEESLRVQDSDKPKGNNVSNPSVVNMVEHNNSFRYNDKNGVNVDNKANGLGTKGSVDDSSNSLKGATVHVCKNRCWFKTCESLNDGSILHMRNDSTALVHGRGCVDLRLNIVNENIASAFVSTSKLNDSIIWHARLGHVHFKRMQDMSKDGLIPAFDMDTEKFLINSIIESRDAIFDEKIFSSVSRPSLSIPKGTEDICSSMVPEKFTEKVVQDEVSDEHSYYFNVEDDPKTFDEVIKSRDVAFWKESINDEIDSIIGNNTWMALDRSQRIDYFDTYAPVARISTIRLLIAMTSIYNMIIHQMGAKTAFLNGELDEEVLKKFNYFDCTSMSTPMDTSEKLMLNNGHAVSQLEYPKVIGCLMYAMTCTQPDIAFAVGKLSSYISNLGTQHWQAIQRVLKYLKKSIDYRLTYTGYPSLLEGYTNASWINNTEDNSSISGWVFLLGGGAISWDSKKQTCITSSTMEYEFVALATAGKEVEWLRNLILEIPLWSKPIAHISIRCDSATTLAKAYS